ncbi:MAG: hypothetical protein QG597_3731, partial [Actinomycetota bacterium]|nr:hypothetical protein [Actinomycetota bacterium]
EDLLTITYGEPETLAWSRDAAAEIMRTLPSTTAEFLRRDERWELRVFDGPMSTLVVAFRSDGSWVTADQRIGTWRSVKEGGAQIIARSIARDFAAAHGSFTRRPLRTIR